MTKGTHVLEICYNFSWPGFQGHRWLKSKKKMESWKLDVMNLVVVKVYT